MNNWTFKSPRVGDMVKMSAPGFYRVFPIDRVTKTRIRVSGFTFSRITGYMIGAPLIEVRPATGLYKLDLMTNEDIKKSIIERADDLGGEYLDRLQVQSVRYEISNKRRRDYREVVKSGCKFKN